MKVSLVVAASDNHMIGKDNQLLWHLPKDMKFFKDTTWAMPVIMGRKTFESLGKRVLPGRLNIILSKQVGLSYDQTEVVGSIAEAIALAERENYAEVFVIGGGQIYQEAMSIADRIALMDKGEVVQIATPVEMYSAPKTKFVADFIGTSNLFAGALTSGSITVKGKSLPTPATQLAAGTKVVLVVRPEDIELGTNSTISGTLVSSNFYGGSSLLFVNCGFDQLVKVSCALNQVPPVGSVCNLSWNPSDSILLTDA